MNYRQNDGRMYRPRNPTFSSETRNPRPFFRHPPKSQRGRSYQQQLSSDIRHFSQTRHKSNPIQFSTNQNIQQNTNLTTQPPHPSSFQDDSSSQFIDPPRNRPVPGQTNARISCAGDGGQDNEFQFPTPSSNMPGSSLSRSMQQQIHQEDSHKSNFSVPPFERKDVINKFEMENNVNFVQYSGSNNFNLGQNNPMFQNNNRSQDKGSFFSKNDNNQSAQVQIPGLDTIPECSNQSKNINFQAQVCEGPMGNFPNQSLRPANLSQSSLLGRQQEFSGFQGIHPQHIENLQPANVQQPMMSLPPPPRPQFLQPESNISQSMRNQEINISAQLLQSPNIQSGTFQNQNFPHNHDNRMKSGFMEQNIRQPSELLPPETHKVQPYQPKKMSSEFLSMNSNIYPNDFRSSTNQLGVIMNDSKSEKGKDEQWINGWLFEKGKQNMEQTIPERFGTNVCSVQEKIKRMMFLMASLQKQIKVLSKCNRSQFDEEMRTASRFKEEMDTIRKFLTAVETKELAKKVRKRIQKRERMKRQREEKYLMKQREMEHREQLHKEIDERLDKIYKEHEDKRQQKELKKTADKILGEVRKKTQDITRAADLLKNLKKLRKLRKERLSQQGIFIKPETDVDFDDKIQDSATVLNKQQEVYNAENKALNVILQTEKEENLEKERERQEKIIRNKEMKRLKKEKRLLFGDAEPCDMNDPMFIFQQYYDQANVDFNALIQIRCDWDRFCVPENTPGGSRIPDGFVIPEKPSSDVWASVLKDDT